MRRQFSAAVMPFSFIGAIFGATCDARWQCKARRGEAGLGEGEARQGGARRSEVTQKSGAQHSGREA